ncbi:MAG: sodium-dependent transporter [Bacteroidales bacterium]|nr:sodium-dependent transporter [Bacteroidales bacterium]
MATERETFGGRLAVIMAMAGSAIGLGNIWRFPYMVGEYGGAAFIFIYILASVFLSLPIFLAESIIGRRSGANCRGAMRKLAPGSWWKWLGYLSVFTPMVIVSYYSVVGGWSLDYLFQALGASFVRNDASQVSNTFSNLISSTWTPIFCHLGFMAITVFIVAAGVKSGIEKFSKFCLPVLFILIVAIMVFSISLPGAREGVNYLLKPDFSKITAKTFAFALGQSFYSLSLGMGIIITYSSYVSKRENLFVSAAGTAFFDLLFAIIAGFAIMPAVFAAGIEPSSGAGLIFQTLPFVFNKMGATMPWITSIAAILFFLTILFSALTSSVSLVEVGVAYLTEEKRMKRGWACFWIFLVTGIVGVFASLSFGPLSGVHFFGKGFFDFLDTFSSNFLLTIGGFLCVVFVGWKMSKANVKDEFTNGGKKKLNEKIFGVAYFLMKYLAPIAVAIIFVTNLIL